MKIQSMFQKDINRNINGVIKVAQNDDSSLKQELSEYIITNELRRHFRTFFDNYKKMIDEPTGNIGVWISGFFGSGKSHFLKMLSYLLENKEVGGKKAIDYFADKFGDTILKADVDKCVSIPTESILFNIDVEGPVDKDNTAVLRVFAKMFYNHCGFYGNDWKLVKLERFIEKHGKTSQFRETFEKVHGAPWTDERDSFAFWEDDVVKVLQSVLGMSEQAARNWFNGEETNELSIAQLVADIKEYVDGKGKNFRLLFMVDEVGQYIGDDRDLMLNLQSLVEEIGTHCGGKVWVMVTSQEAIDSIVRVPGNDFSRIQDRFNTRLSLSSSSVDEVIKKRVLAKNEEADMLLRMVYDEKHAVLKNLYAFNNPVLDIKGFSDGAEYAASYPFVPYQFIIIQKVLAEIRKHGNAGKHLAGGERSMLSGFQEAAQKVQDKDENALVPFYLFYDTVHTFLGSEIRRVIECCQSAADNHDGLEQQDVSVLKLLYLVRYIDDIRANVDNIAILMIDDIRTDKIALRASVKESLGRLLTQNYISCNGDTYAFLTDEEQKIAIEIRDTVVDNAQVTQSIANIVFGEIYPAKKFKYNKYDFAYDQYIDDRLHGSASGGMRLRIITVANDYHSAPDQRLIADSGNNEAIVVLSNETPYFEELEQAKKIHNYIKGRNVSQLSETIQDIIRKHQQQAHTLEERAQSYIEKAIEGAKFVVHGKIMEIKTGSAKEKLDVAMRYLVESVYDQLSMVNKFVESDADIIAILNGADSRDPFLGGLGANNGDALNEISQWLELQNNRMITTSMHNVQNRYSTIPYGWREIDIAAMIAQLIVQQRISIRYGGAIVRRDDRKLVDYLRKKSEIDKAVIVRRRAPSEDLIRENIRFLRDYLGVMDIPPDEDGLIGFVLGAFERKRQHYGQILEEYRAQSGYPGRDIVTQAYELISDVLSQHIDNVAILNRIVDKQKELLDTRDDMENVEFFFKSQQRVIYDEAFRQKERIDKEHYYFASDSKAEDTFRALSSILAMPAPYSRIGELPELISKIKSIYEEMLNAKKAEVLENIRQCAQDVHQLAADINDAADLMRQADDHFDGKNKAAEDASTLIELDAMITQISGYKENICRRMEDIAAAKMQPVPANTGETRHELPKQQKIASVRRYDICPAKRLQTREDIDQYVEGIREKLMMALENCDGIQIN